MATSGSNRFNDTSFRSYKHFIEEDEQQIINDEGGPSYSEVKTPDITPQANRSSQYQAETSFGGPIHTTQSQLVGYESNRSGHTIKITAFLVLVVLLLCCVIIGLISPLRGKLGKEREIVDNLLKNDGTVRSSLDVLGERLDALFYIIKHFSAPEITSHFMFNATNGHIFFMTSYPMTYADGKDYCISMNTKLASAGMRDVWIRQEVWMNLLQPNANNAVWIGLDDLKTEGKWYFVDGVLATSDNTPWLPGEPNDANGEDCACLSPYIGFYLNDCSCDSMYYALCESNT